MRAAQTIDTEIAKLRRIAERQICAQQLQNAEVALSVGDRSFALATLDDFEGQRRFGSAFTAQMLRDALAKTHSGQARQAA